MAALKYLHVTKVSPRELRSAKSGKLFRLAELQGLMMYDDGSSDVFVLDVFDSEKMPVDTLKPGNWLPTVELFPARDSRKLEARIVDLRAAQPVPVSKAG